VIPRKRLDWAVRILDALDDPRVTLVACGIDDSHRVEILSRIRPEVRSRVCLVPFVEEELMPSLYAGAAAVLYPTLYEGFGLPVLEAQAVGTPILFSALGSLAELIGPGSVVLDPDDLTAWVGACRAFVESRGEDPQPDERAKTWARGFSWDACANRHLDIYRSASKPRRHAAQAVGFVL
jgi:glycosyltransferase involved in cell wall biosynthesis